MLIATTVESKLALSILAQPDDSTCGPTCLHAVYGYYGDAVWLGSVIAGVTTLPGGGTLAAHLGCHALDRGYRAKLYSFDLTVFDITWFTDPGLDLAGKLAEQLR